ncbi:Protein SDA1 [Gaertneriomyces sp. JEL0708]|nr:Protein SDA1 [Gaertneriomyces sp. JEL0708]
MVKRSRAEFLACNLPQLQNLIKRDPQSYRDEFLQQWRHYESALAIFRLKPESDAKEFGELITFISHVSFCYQEDCTQFPQQLIDILSTHYQILEPELRRTMVQALVLLRNKDLISTTSLLSLFFTLFRAKDKQLRSLLHSHIVNDIKNANAKTTNNKLNKTLQNFMYTMLKDSNETAAKKSLEVMIDLYKKNVWNDAKTVNVIAEACFSPVPKIVAPALHFFLGSNDKKDDDQDSDGDVPDISALKHMAQVNKKKKSRRTAIEKAIATTKRKERAKMRAETFNFSALHLLNDPQGFTEKLFSRLKHSTSSNSFKFELRLQMMNLVSRMIGIHKLIVFGFYEYVIKYLKPQQRDVTAILAYVAQSSHELVPPDALSPVLQAIADNFVWNNMASEVVTAGLNGLREVCARSPLAMSETLLQSLIEDYKNHREKGPMNAARSLLGLYREVNPEMLKKKDRGKVASMSLKEFKPAMYGEVRVSTGIDGAEFLERLNRPDSDSDEDEQFEVSDSDSISDTSCDGRATGNDEWCDIESEEDDTRSVDDADGWDEWEEASMDGDDEEDVNTGSGDDEQAVGTRETTGAEPSPAKKPKLGIAAEKILTDEDFRKLRKIQQLRAAQKLAGVHSENLDEDLLEDSDDGAVDEDDGDVVDVSRIMKGIRRKDDYEARLASIKAGREGRDYGSKKNKEERGSKTNREKSKQKAVMMMVHKKSVKGKSKRSLREKQKVLRAHIKKQKMKKH